MTHIFFIQLINIYYIRKLFFDGIQFSYIDFFIKQLQTVNYLWLENGLRFYVVEILSKYKFNPKETQNFP